MRRSSCRRTFRHVIGHGSSLHQVACSTLTDPSSSAQKPGSGTDPGSDTGTGTGPGNTSGGDGDEEGSSEPAPKKRTIAPAQSTGCNAAPNHGTDFGSLVVVPGAALGIAAARRRKRQPQP